MIVAKRYACSFTASAVSLKSNINVEALLTAAAIISDKTAHIIYIWHCYLLLSLFFL